MLDLKIKNIDLDIKNEEDKIQFFRKSWTVTEKIDGVKLTLTRNNEDYNEDYTKNWIISYKGIVIHNSEMPKTSLETIKSTSVGFSQYKIVHNHIKKIHKNKEIMEKIPKSMEFFIEFQMRKSTLTRIYKKTHVLFLIDAKLVNYIVTNDFLYSSTINNHEEDILPHITHFSDWLNIQLPPKLYYGYFHYNILNINWSFDKLKEYWLSVDSCLGGKVEGVVLSETTYHQSQLQYKIVQPDQYDKEFRKSIKSKYKKVSDPNYWRQIEDFSVNFLTQYNNETISALDFLERIKKEIYGNTKYFDLEFQDDLYLSIRLGLLKIMTIDKNTKTVGLLVMNGKPIHNGHISIINKMLEENDRIILFISNSGRKKNDIQLSDKGAYLLNMLYQKVLLQNDKIQVIFDDNPYVSLKHFISSITGIIKKVIHFNINVYSGDKDDYISEGFCRDYGITSKKINIDVEISASGMRNFVKLEEKDAFIENLPNIFDKDQKINIYEIIRENII